MPIKAKIHSDILIKKENKKEKEDDEINKKTDANGPINDIVDEKERNNADDQKVVEEEINDTDSLFEDIETKNNELRKESMLTHSKILIKSPI